MTGTGFPRRVRSASAALLWLGALATALPASALELRVLSAGAVEPGMRPALAAFTSASGHAVRLTFAAAPELRTALATPAPAADVVVAPQALLEPSARGAGQRVPIGRVGIGVVVRDDVERPDISSAESLKQALLAADSIVFNRASTGVYVEAMLRRLGLADAVAAKVQRTADGASVMRHVLAATARREIGFAATTEIALFRDQGLGFVGPLPASLQNYTTYVASAWPDAPADPARDEAVAALLAFLREASTRALFVGVGIEPAP